MVTDPVFVSCKKFNSQPLLKKLVLPDLSLYQRNLLIDDLVSMRLKIPTMIMLLLSYSFFQKQLLQTSQKSSFPTLNFKLYSCKKKNIKFC